MKYQLKAPGSGLIVEMHVSDTSQVTANSELLVYELMKMQSVLHSPVSGRITKLFVSLGDMIESGQLIMEIDLTESDQIDEPIHQFSDKHPDSYREWTDRIQYLKDENRPEALASRKGSGKNMARENIRLLVDSGSFFEYGSLIVAAQRQRKSLKNLMESTPADGLITGIARINGDAVCGNTKAVILAYDYTVLAGTQGMFNHAKFDRMIELAEKDELPIILFAEGGGGRPGDVDVPAVAGLHLKSFYNYARIAGKIPRLAIASGYCFAGNAALARISDFLIGTADLSLGMGGPSMIEGGGLGSYKAEEIGPAQMHSEIGTLDLLVRDENEAIAKAKQLLSYFQGEVKNFSENDQSSLLEVIPKNRKMAFDIRSIIERVADKSSFLELKKDHARNMTCGFMRVGGKTYGVIANNSRFNGGVIDSEGARKAALQLSHCSQFGIPLLSFIDTPGIMVGPESERRGTVTAASELFRAGAGLKVPMYAIVVRRAYGLGAMAMAGGSFHASAMTLSWPTGEFGAMGIEGAVKLGFRKEINAENDLDKRKELIDQLIHRHLNKGKAISMASFFEIDEVIDPRLTRHWIISRQLLCT